jgi:hypothetical protein
MKIDSLVSHDVSANVMNSPSNLIKLALVVVSYPVSLPLAGLTKLVAVITGNNCLGTFSARLWNFMTFSFLHTPEKLADPQKLAAPIPQDSQFAKSDFKLPIFDETALKFPQGNTPDPTKSKAMEDGVKEAIVLPSTVCSSPSEQGETAAYAEKTSAIPIPTDDTENVDCAWKELGQTLEQEVVSPPERPDETLNLLQESGSPLERSVIGDSQEVEVPADPEGSKDEPSVPAQNAQVPTGDGQPSQGGDNPANCVSEKSPEETTLPAPNPSNVGPVAQESADADDNTMIERPAMQRVRRSSSDDNLRHYSRDDSPNDGRTGGTGTTTTGDSKTSDDADARTVIGVPRTQRARTSLSGDDVESLYGGPGTSGDGRTDWTDTTTDGSKTSDYTDYTDYTEDSTLVERPEVRCMRRSSSDGNLGLRSSMDDPLKDGSTDGTDESKNDDADDRTMIERPATQRLMRKSFSDENLRQYSMDDPLKDGSTGKTATTIDDSKTSDDDGDSTVIDNSQVPERRLERDSSSGGNITFAHAATDIPEADPMAGYDEAPESAPMEPQVKGILAASSCPVNMASLGHILPIDFQDGAADFGLSISKSDNRISDHSDDENNFAINTSIDVDQIELLRANEEPGPKEMSAPVEEPLVPEPLVLEVSAQTSWAPKMESRPEAVALTPPISGVELDETFDPLRQAGVLPELDADESGNTLDAVAPEGELPKVPYNISIELDDDDQS